MLQVMGGVDDWTLPLDHGGIRVEVSDRVEKKSRLHFWLI